METSPQPAHTNRLINATSPYLLQHAHNPVDWYEWGEAALAKARSEDKPIFLSIGYSACHWCHVMAHESFEDETTAAAMNRHFVCIKVDREERPDIDEIYMQATMLANRGNGGWPMSVWLTPDLKPFLAGTYFPPESRWGGPGFKDLCEQIGAAWAGNREQLLANADQLSDAVTRTLSASSARDATFSLADIDDAVNALAGAFDSQRGGILSGGTNKFPPSMALDLFMRAIVRHGPEHPQSQRLRELVEVTLDNMANGGIYDHLAGGFARYSTDPEWARAALREDAPRPGTRLSRIPRRLAAHAAAALPPHCDRSVRLRPRRPAIARRRLLQLTRRRQRRRGRPVLRLDQG